MATKCPLCGEGTLKKGEKMVYCNKRIIRKEGGQWYNEGECDFFIPFANKAFGRNLTDRDIRSLLNGEEIKNKKGDKMTLDLDSEYYTHIEFADKKEDKDF